MADKTLTLDELKGIIADKVGEELSEKKLADLLKPMIEAGVDTRAAALKAMATPPPAPVKSATPMRDFLKASVAARENKATADQAKLLGGTVEKDNYSTTTAGGYLIPTQQGTELINLVYTYSVIPGLCRRIPMGSATMTLPTKDGGATCYFLSEATDSGSLTLGTNGTTHSALSFGQFTLTARKVMAELRVNRNLLEDSDPAIEGILNADLAEAVGDALDTSCLTGTGAPAFTGIDSTTNVQSFGVDAEFNFDDLVKLTSRVGEYTRNGATIDLIAHNRGIERMLKIKDSNGQYLWRNPNQPGTQLAGSVWGNNVYRDNNVGLTYGTGSDETRIYAGAFGTYAYFGLRSALEITADPYTYAHADVVRFFVRTRAAFGIAQPYAFGILSGIPTA